jgi:hypothetical protein
MTCLGSIRYLYAFANRNLIDLTYRVLGDRWSFGGISCEQTKSRAVRGFLVGKIGYVNRYAANN